jgi:hypothetical protein
MRDALCALRDVLIFIAFVGLLVTAPTWGAWLDSLGEDDAWERAVADHHAKVYERIRQQ